MPVNSSCFLLASMIILQAAWLAGIKLTRATLSTEKLARIVMYDIALSLIFLLACIFVPERMFFGFAIPSGWNLSGRLGLALVFISTFITAFIYSHFQRIWPFDEEGNLNAARHFASEGWRRTFSHYTELPWLGVQHPPLIPVLGGVIYRIFGVKTLLFRLLNVGFMLGVLLVTYQTGALLYDPFTGFLAVVLCLSFPLFWRLGCAAMLDMPATFWFGLVLLIILHARIQAVSPMWFMIFAGMVVGLGLLTRYTMVFIYPVLLVLVISGWLSWSSLALIALVSSLFFAAWLWYAYRNHILHAQLRKLQEFAGMKPGYPEPRTQNIGILGPLGITRGWRMRLRLESLFSRLPSGIGTYNLPIILTGFLMVFQHRQPADAVLAAWIAIPSILLLILLPDHRYFLPVFPALALLMARGLAGTAFSSPLVTALALLFCLGNLYLFVDWQRQTYLFSSKVT